MMRLVQNRKGRLKLAGSEHYWNAFSFPPEGIAHNEAKGNEKTVWMSAGNYGVSKGEFPQCLGWFRTRTILIA